MLVIWYNISMTKAQIERRQRAVDAAVGSVKAEGLNPSAKTKKRLKDYAEGKITVAQLRSATLDEVKGK